MNFPEQESGLGNMLRFINILLRARHLTITILSLIHRRELLLLALMSGGETERLRNTCEELVAVSDKLVLSVAEWRACGLPYSKFVYLDEDYSNKVHEDNAKVLMLFPELQRQEIVEAFLNKGEGENW